MIISTLTALPFTAQAYELTTTTGFCGDDIMYSFDSSTGTLTLKGSGPMYDHPDIFNYCDNIKSVIIGNGITSVGASSFPHCAALESVTIGNDVRTIGYYAFSDCTGLTSVTMGNSVSCIGDYAFDDCKALTRININSIEAWCKTEFSNYSSNPLVYADNLYFNGTLLTNLIIPDSVTSISARVFEYCTGITSITIPDSVTSIGEAAFRGCSGLTSVTIGNSVTSIGNYAFCNCTSLKSITIPDSVTSITPGDNTVFGAQGAFSSCTSLEEVIIGKGIKDIPITTFNNCKSLTDVTLHNSVTSIGNNAFGNCSAIKNVYFVGTQDEWNAIEIGTKNPYLRYAEIHYVDHAHKWNSGEVTTTATCAADGVLTYTCSVCGETKTDVIPKYAHTVVTDDAVEPTCTVAGKTEGKHCSECGEIIIAQTIISPLGHNYDSGTVVTSPTCTEAGEKEYTCSRCGETLTETIEPNGHSITTSRAIEPTCTAEGRTEGKYCSVCGTVVVAQQTVAALGHDYISETIAPTCTSSGYTTHYCSRCYDSYTDNYVDALGHTWNGGVVTTPATETRDGVKTFTCTRCGTTRTESIPRIAHTHAYAPTVTAPTCTAQGYTTYICSGCGDSYVSDYTSALGHDYNSVITSPTCTTGGYTTYTCSRCGDTYRGNETASLGHDYKSVVTAPTCTDGGYTTFTCSRCGDTYKGNSTEALGHRYSKAVVANATCSAEGLSRFTCNLCGDTYTEDIPKLAHTVANDRAVLPSCEATGLTAGTHCAVCGEILTAQEVIPANDHSYEAEVTDPTCTEEGYTTYTCSVCGDEYTANETRALGHVAVVDKAIAATFTKAGKTAGKHCSVCGEEIVEQETVAKLVSPTISKLTAGKKAFTATWKKAPTVDGYQLQYATNAKFSKAKSVTIKKDSTTKTTVKKLTAKKKYYVRVRAYKAINGKKVYSSWSKAKTVTIKK